MFITALCPTLRRPKLIANTLALWRDQDYPLELRRLIILDDGGTYHSQAIESLSVDLFCTDEAFPTLPNKYNFMWRRLAPAQTDAFAIWEDDDLYLPGYLSGHVEALKTHRLSKPEYILTDHGQPGRLQRDHAVGRLHSSMTFHKSLIQDVGGWIDTPSPDFDLQLIAKFTEETAIKDPWPGTPGQFIYAWHTDHPHGQHFMHEGSGWWEEARKALLALTKTEGPIHCPLPEYDKRTLQLLKAYKELAKHD